MGDKEGNVANLSSGRINSGDCENSSGLNPATSTHPLGTFCLNLPAEEGIRSIMLTSGENDKAASRKMERYCLEHPGSPAAVRSPKLSFRSGTWIALLGDNIEDGIAGFGSSVEAALRAFDLIYRESSACSEN